jgi:hypothetical protein
VAAIPIVMLVIGYHFELPVVSEKSRRGTASDDESETFWGSSSLEALLKGFEGLVRVKS